MAFRLIAVTVLLLCTQESVAQLSVCGQANLNTRIVGGQDSPPGFWPWQVSLQNSAHFCGGSLINNQWVMTAAHCFPSDSASGVTVVLGLQSLQGSNPNMVSRSITTLIIHPSYNSGTSDNDIALLQLSSPVTLTSYITPVCLASTGSTFYSGINTWVTGWGDIGSGVSLPSPQTLQEVQVPIVGNRRCKCNYGASTINDNMVCAGLLEGGKDSCQGDSGGPLVIKQNGRWIQAGIVSFGRGCAEPNFPGVYSRVSQYQTWINAQITSNQPGFVSFTSTGTDSDLSVSCPGVPPITNVTTTTTTTTTSVPRVTTTGTTTRPTTTTTSVPRITTTGTTTRPTTTTTSVPRKVTSTKPLTTTTPKAVVCGRAFLNSRVLVGSSGVTAGQWPWMASLQKDGRHVCGGTLVSLDSVLSNADCFSNPPVPSDWTVVLGRLTQNGSNPFEVSLKVTNITLSNQTGSNVAVLQLSAAPVLNEYIQPICLDNGKTFPLGTTCWAAGWSSGRGGEEEVLQEFQTSMLECTRPTNDSFCTSTFTLAEGDSGGPLMCQQGGSWYQAAVLSFARRSLRKRRAATVMEFEKLSQFEDFLVQTVGPFLPSTVNSSSFNPTSPTTASTSTPDWHIHKKIYFYFRLIFHTFWNIISSEHRD